MERVATLFKRIFQLIESILTKELELLDSKLKEYEAQQSMNQFYLEAGKAIESISNLYPANYEDAAIIFEEWCKGMLTECRPTQEMLRRYAKYTGDVNNFRNWITKELEGNYKR